MGYFFPKKNLFQKKKFKYFQGPKYIILNNLFSKKIKKTFPKKIKNINFLWRCR